ncbi:serine hydrolase [Planktothrix sp. FACHB-1365]|uniref:serine hydrolase n=1 Tax=Planktothrix sp. FACHB-1365 TaxID=2692855 RepID=UPI0016843224|nr:serine hydrolase [Planktothrix sp. FACHB-1365]MBD2483379.1 serine hydrolase [Planktothrix sp. FACHB-1365]
MRQVWRWAITVTGSMTLIVGLGLTQALPSLGTASELYGARSLKELIVLRDRLIQELETPPKDRPEPNFFNSLFADPLEFEPNEILLQKLKTVEVQILVEERAEDSWKQAIRLATQAQKVANPNDPSPQQRKQVQDLWEKAINNLQEIPPHSLLAGQTSNKIKEYESSLSKITDKLLDARAKILEQIRQESGLTRQAMLTVCTLKRDCVNLRGNEPPASPASLIKVPVAIALLHKTAEEKISLDQKILVAGGNFTEDASSIRARQSYSLKELMGVMIDHSSNIATNQLIDYLGSDYINKFLEAEGYKFTKVNFKLMGDHIMPWRPGKGRNRLTSNELTEMMVEVYNYEHPSSQVLIDALNRQYDRVIGYAGLQGLPKTQWLGEKTGQNSRVIGTTVAAQINGEKYIITAIDNNTANVPQISTSVHKIAEYIVENGQL